MKVVLFGATGFAGKEVLHRLLEKEHQVTILVRDASRIDIENENLIVKKGNVLNVDTLDTVIHDQDAVINCLGIRGKGNGKPNSFISRASTLIVKSMETNGVQRFICLSNVGAGDSAGSQPWFFEKIILPYFMKWLKVIIDDKNVMEPVIMQSSLDWTIVRCPNIIDRKAKGTIQTSLNGRKLKWSITNPDVADFMTQQLSDDTYSRKSPSISN
jgi:putative NADH-flavin reductase